MPQREELGILEDMRASGWHAVENEWHPAAWPIPREVPTPRERGPSVFAKAAMFGRKAIELVKTPFTSADTEHAFAGAHQMPGVPSMFEQEVNLEFSE